MNFRYAWTGLTVAFAVAVGPSAAKASTVISFTDPGTYGVSFAPWEGSAVASASFDITFDPTQLYLTQSIAGVITNLTYSVTDPRFSPSSLILSDIVSFAYDGTGTLTLYSDAALNKSLAGTSNITIGINGWAYPQASSGGVSITETAAVPLPAALPLFAGGLGLMGWLARRRRKQAAHA